jgi:histidine ammonia-lyase
MKPLVLKPGSVSLADLKAIYDGALPSLDESCREKIAAAAGVIQKIVDKGDPVYGINTGFGKLASVRIAAEDVETLQRNLILSHCCGVGAPLAPEIVRLVMALKLASLGRGASGVRAGTVEMIEAMLAKNVVLVIPEKGSVGASGDLAPLAHMTAASSASARCFSGAKGCPLRKALKRQG